MDATGVEEPLMGQAARPDAVTIGAPHHVAPGFTTKESEADRVR